MWDSIKNIGAAIFICMIFADCSGPIQRDMLVGRYKANGSDEVVELRLDGTYNHYFEVVGKQKSTSDKWELDLVENEPTVVLHHFTPVVGIHAGIEAMSLLHVSRASGTIRLSTADESVFYERTSNSIGP